MAKTESRSRKRGAPRVRGGSQTLPSLLADLASGRLRVVDLTQTLSPDMPQISLPPELGQAMPFRIEEISHYDERGPGWYWNNFACSEHTGTHFDAPIHWVSGRDLPHNSVDTLPLDSVIAPACVIDCSAQAAADADFLLTQPFVQRWERLHGRIPPRSWVLMRTDWSKRTDAAAYCGLCRSTHWPSGVGEGVTRGGARSQAFSSASSGLAAQTVTPWPTPGKERREGR